MANSNKNFEYVKRIADEINGLVESPDQFYEYFEDVLDVEYRVNSEGKYKGVVLYITLGGPNVWVDTCQGRVNLAWGYDRAEDILSEQAVDMIDDLFSEYYVSVKGWDNMRKSDFYLRYKNDFHKVTGYIEIVTDQENNKYVIGFHNEGKYGWGRNSCRKWLTYL